MKIFLINIFVRFVCPVFRCNNNTVFELDRVNRLKLEITWNLTCIHMFITDF